MCYLDPAGLKKMGEWNQMGYLRDKWTDWQTVESTGKYSPWLGQVRLGSSVCSFLHIINLLNLVSCHCSMFQEMHTSIGLMGRVDSGARSPLFDWSPNRWEATGWMVPRDGRKCVGDVIWTVEVGGISGMNSAKLKTSWPYFFWPLIQWYLVIDYLLWWWQRERKKKKDWINLS